MTVYNPTKKPETRYRFEIFFELFGVFFIISIATFLIPIFIGTKNPSMAKSDGFFSFIDFFYDKHYFYPISSNLSPINPLWKKTAQQSSLCSIFKFHESLTTHIVPLAPRHIGYLHCYINYKPMFFILIPKTNGIQNQKTKYPIFLFFYKISFFIAYILLKQNIIFDLYLNCKIMKNKFVTISIHIIAWSLLLMVPFISSYQVVKSFVPSKDTISLVPIITLSFIYIVIFYFNYFVLIPRYLLLKKYLLYAGMLLLSIVVAFVLSGIYLNLSDLDPDNIGLINPIL